MQCFIRLLVNTYGSNMMNIHSFTHENFWPFERTPKMVSLKLGPLTHNIKFRLRMHNC